MTTLYISIGNSDDKLTQKEWSEYCAELLFIVESGMMERTYGVWYSAPDSKFQSMCVAVECPQERVMDLRFHLSELCKKYRQDSIALSYGQTTLLPPSDKGKADD